MHSLLFQLNLTGILHRLQGLKLQFELFKLHLIQFFLSHLAEDLLLVSSEAFFELLGEVVEIELLIDIRSDLLLLFYKLFGEDLF